MITDKTNNTLKIYPIEQPFKFPLILTTLLVLLPSLALYWFFGDTNNAPRAFKIFFGNWISPIILWLFCASFLHLLLKRKRLQQEQQQSAAISQTFLPAITADDALENDEQAILAKLQKHSIENDISAENLLVSRLTLFLNHHDDDVDETFGMKEREYMRSSFSLSRFMVWAVPIMGFIGTVWGISNGIAHFSDAMTMTSSVTDVSAMLKENLPMVTSSLATAFDTTLLALLLSIPLMMLMISLEKSEEAYLIDLDERWFHDIKPALQNIHGSNSIKSVASTQNQTPNQTHNNESNHKVAGEIKLLSTQIKALQETMEDLYETVFTSNLSNKKGDKKT